MGQLAQEALARKYQDKVQFVFVYGRESHPEAPAGSTLGGEIAGEAHSWEARADRARRFRDSQQSIRLFLVDEDIENSVEDLYKNRIHSLCVVGVDGRITFKQDFTNTQELDAFLEMQSYAAGN